MHPFFQFTVLVPKNKVNLRRKALIRVDTIAGVQELNHNTCKLILERRDGTVEEYLVEAGFDTIKDRLDAVLIHNNTAEDTQQTE